MNWDFLFSAASVTAEKNRESFAAEGGLLPEYKAIVGELLRLNLYSSVKVAQLGKGSDGIFVITKHPREAIRVEAARLRGVIAQIQGLPQEATWDDIRPILDPPEPLQGLNKFQEQLDALGFGQLSFSSSEEKNGRVVYRAFSLGRVVARCICKKDQWGYWSYQLTVLVKRSYSGSSISIDEDDYDLEVAFDGNL
jgi:hypothetical protein